MKTIVIGAGVIGCSLARGLALAGEDVTVLDASSIAAEASGRSFGWINASFHANPHHFRLRHAGIAAWHRLEAARGALPISWCGALCWEGQGAALQADKTRLEGLGYEVRHLDGAALRQALPELGGLPAEALAFPQEGVAEAGALTRALASDAARQGARFVTGVRAEALATQGGRVSAVVTAQGHLPADRVVVAAGTGATSLAQGAGVALPMLPRPGLLLTTRPVPPVLDKILVTPQGEIRQLPDGRIMMPTSVGHQGDTAEVISDPPQHLADQALARIAPYFPSLDLALEEVALAWRPVPGDGLPVVGPAGPRGLYLAVMHSGVTLAAIMAELAIPEILTGQRHDLLAPYHPDRFA